MSDQLHPDFFSAEEKVAVIGCLILLVQAKDSPITQADEELLGEIADNISCPMDENVLNAIRRMGSDTLFDKLDKYTDIQRKWFVSQISRFLNLQQVVDDNQYTFAKFLCFEMDIWIDEWPNLLKTSGQLRQE